MTAVLDAAETQGNDDDPSSRRDPARPRGGWLVPVLACVFAWACGLVAGWFGGIVPFACCLVIAVLALVKADSRYVPAHTFGLDGVHDGPPPVISVSGRVHLLVLLLGSAAIVALSIAEVAPTVSVAVVLVVALVTWLRCAPAVIGRRHLKKVRRALRRHAPTVGIAFAGKLGGPFQLGQWEPHVLESGERSILFNVHARHNPRILQTPGITAPVVQLGSRGSAELDDLMTPSLRAMFYVQHAARNLDFMAYDGMTHVWLGHGDSDKPTSYTASHRRYDLIVVAGQAGIDRYRDHGADIAGRQFVVVGRPQTKGLARPDRPIAERSRKTVLYAPTWQGTDDASDFSSLDLAPDLVQALLERGVAVIFRPHPLSYFWKSRREIIGQVRAILDEDREASGRPHAFGSQVDRRWSLVDCLNRSDAVVTDVSAVATDALASAKPFAMTSMRLGVEQFRRTCPVAESAYVILGDMRNLDDVLDDLLYHDPMALARDEHRSHVLSDLDGEESSRAFAQFVRTLVAAQ